MAEGWGDAVGVGWGIFNFTPVDNKQEAGKLLSKMMLLIDTLNVPAIELHVSPCATVYSTGGKGVKVGSIVGVAVEVGVIVMVGVMVICLLYTSPSPRD